MAFTVRILAWREAMPLARPVRQRVFIEEQGVPQALEWDEWDEPSEHAIAFDASGMPIGTARLLPTGSIGRMAVLRERRREGVGSQLLESLLERARNRRLKRVTLHAQTHAAGFYRRFGFSAQGNEFLEAGIRHVEMVLDLHPTPE